MREERCSTREEIYESERRYGKEEEVNGKGNDVRERDADAETNGGIIEGWDMQSARSRKRTKNKEVRRRRIVH